MTLLDEAHHAAGSFVGNVLSVTTFGGGHINHTFLVVANTGEYVLQRLNMAVFTDVDGVMRNIRSVLRHLNGRLVPELVDAAGPWRLWRRVPNAGPLTQATSTTAASAGELLGHFHTLVADLEPTTLTETLPNFHDATRRLDALRGSIATDRHGRARLARREIDALLAAAPLADRADALTATVPERVAHYDAKLDNVLFRGDDAVSLVDLDTLMPGAWFWDVGDLLRTAATRGAEDDPDQSAIDPELYAAVLDGYRRGARDVLDPVEVEALSDAGAVVTYEQAVRFLTDWLDGDVYYRTFRPDQNLDRARAQLRLLASMPTTVRWS